MARARRGDDREVGMCVFKRGIALTFALGIGLLPISGKTKTVNQGEVQDINGMLRELRASVAYLQGRVRQLEELDKRILAYGFVDEQGLHKYIRPDLGAPLDNEAARISDIRMENVRPGVFELIISPKLARAPIIIVSSGNKWRDVPSLKTYAQVERQYDTDVAKNSELIKFVVTLSQKEIPKNCEFSFVILSGDKLQNPVH